MNRINVTERYSANLTLRTYRRALGSHQAYWLAVARHGWQSWQKIARRQLDRPAKTALRFSA